MLQITKGILLHIHFGGELSMGPSRDTASLAPTLKLWLTFSGECNSGTGLLVNVSHIKKAMRQELEAATIKVASPLDIINWSKDIMSGRFEGCNLQTIKLDLNEELSIISNIKEPEMIELTRKYEIAAAHQLYNNNWDAERNKKEFGKCSNPAGHGHNYLIEVSVKGLVNKTGRLLDVDSMDQIVNEKIVEAFDHKFLNTDNPEFLDLNPTVENMVNIFWDILEGDFAPAKLSKIKIWETPTTFSSRQI